MLKRVFDLVIVLILLPIWLPVAVLVGLAVRVFLGAPILFCDQRAGLLGRPFTMFKFRSMIVGPGDDADRLTGFGRFLRASSLDELPELWNVLRGEMSLVGPRPLPVRYLSRYSVEQNRRHEVLPGITGLAQINGRNALSWEEKFSFDLDYVERHSVFRDLKILFLTIFKTLVPRGINHASSSTMPEFIGGGV